MKQFIVVTLAAFAAAAPSILQKRCSPVYDEELHNGYKPPQPCWLAFGTACEPYIMADTELTVDAENNKVTVVGISQSCVDDIAEEHAREEDGRKTYGWTEEIGKLDTSEADTLIITEMDDSTIEEYQQLDYQTASA